MCDVECVMSSVRCGCQIISGGMVWGEVRGQVSLIFFKPLKALIIIFLKIASVKR